MVKKEKKVTEKYNDSCIKLFEFIEKMYEDEADFKTVINLFSNGKYDGTSNTHVTLNKYLNALKIFGVKVKKQNKKYHMLTPLYKMKFTFEDLKSIALLKDALTVLPNGKDKNNFKNFINMLEKRFDENAQSLSQIERTTKSLHLDFAQSKMDEQMEQYEQYCQDNQKLEIVFTTEKGEDINILCSPLEQIYEKRKIWLKVLSNNGTRIYDIPIDSIKSIKQLPISSSQQSIPTTVVYRIKNRLAQNYKIRDWEKCETIEADGSHIIVNKNEDLYTLVKRLMRYGRECEIISPKFMKEEMIDRINKTLANYK